MKKEKLLLTAFIFSVIMFFIILGIEKSNAQNINISKEGDIYNNYHETLPVIVKSSLISGAAYIMTYEIFFHNTSIEQNNCRLIGVGAALITGAILYHIDKNNETIGYNIYGSLLAGFTLTIIINHDKKRNLKRKLIEI